MNEVQNIIKKLFFLTQVLNFPDNEIEKNEAIGIISLLVNIAHNKENQWHNRAKELQFQKDLVNKYYKSKKIKDILNND